MGGGTSNYTSDLDDDGDGTFYQSMTGNFDDPNYFGTWLSEDMNVSLYHTSTMYVDDADHFGGGFSVFWNAWSPGLWVRSTRSDCRTSTCTREHGLDVRAGPSGSIAVRDDGSWYEAEFDGPSTDAGARRTVMAAARSTGAANFWVRSVPTLACL